MTPDRFPTPIEQLGDLALALYEAAEEAARAALAERRRARTDDAAAPRGRTLRPGADTPLWNELAAAVRPHLATRGAKAKLARILGIPRQRVHDYLQAGSAAPNAERTLLLLCWVAARRAGRELAA